MSRIPTGYGGTASAGGASNNVRGNECEQTIFRALNILGLKEGVDFVHTKNVDYSDHNECDSICEDFIFPNQTKPHTLLSVTHSHPTRKGHSNENKTHQHIGETWLFKTHDRTVRHIAYLGGNNETWLNYVPHTISLFQDYTIFDWKSDGSKKTDIEIANELRIALNCDLRNNEFWKNERDFRMNNEGISKNGTYDRSKLTAKNSVAIPTRSFRTEFFINVIQPMMGVQDISEVDNEILLFMLQNSGKSAIKKFKVSDFGYYKTDIDKKTNSNGIRHASNLKEIAKEFKIKWTNKKNVISQILSNDNIPFWKYGRLWDFLKNARREDPSDPKSAYRFWKERSDHNPTEAAFELLLNRRNFNFVSEINSKEQKDMHVTPNLLYEHHNWVPNSKPGAKKTHRRTDFKLQTKDGTHLYVECKSSGGGDGGSSNKHITDRVREQVARSVIHRCSYDSDNKKLVSKSKKFLWYYILDNNWKTPKKWPCKYVNNLEMSGVDGYFAASDLVDEEFNLNLEFGLLEILQKHSC
jgi:hypothetical protein